MNTPSNPAPLAITMGDACGIGPEIVIKACADPASASTPLIVYGDPAVLSREAARLGLPLPARIEACSALPADLPQGCIDARAGLAAYDAVVRASRDALAGRVRAVVTAPLHKEALHAAGIRHPGHTEILADVAGVPDVRMMLVNDELRTLLVTIHVALREAIERITLPAVLDTIRIGHEGLKRMDIAAPRIAVAGLNPHAGEGGLMGREDLEIIAPAVAAARAEGIDASGPWPGDTVFMRARGFREFDLVVAMYHDQGLIPIKYLGIDTGVNVTVGLPFVRTSVDHGTAFDIAGHGIADHRSLLAALRLADTLSAPAQQD